MLDDPLSDSSGNLYWLEMLGGENDPVELVSISAAGAFRFRARVTDKFDWVWRMALGDDAVFITSHASVSAYDLADGHQRWTHSYAAELNDTPDRYFGWEVAVAPDGRPTVAIPAMRRASENESYSWVPGLDHDGSVRWKHQILADHLSVDEDGNVLVADSSAFALISIAPDGALRWTFPSFAGALEDLAVWNGAVVGDSVVRASDGTAAGSLGLGQQASSEFALLGPSASYLGYDDFDFAPGKVFLAPMNLAPPTSGPGSPLWPDVSYKLGPQHPYPVLMTEGRVLAPAGVPADGCQSQYAIRVVARKGDVSSCQLSGVVGPDISLVVQPQRLFGWFASSCGGPRGGLVAFDAPALAPETHGWITYRGSFARNGRAQ